MPATILGPKIKPYETRKCLCLHEFDGLVREKDAIKKFYEQIRNHDHCW